MSRLSHLRAENVTSSTVLVDTKYSKRQKMSTQLTLGVLVLRSNVAYDRINVEESLTESTTL